MGAIPRSGATQPRGYNKGNLRGFVNFTLAHASSSLLTGNSGARRKQGDLFKFYSL